MTNSSHADHLQDRLLARSASIGIIGQGYVGLPLALLFAESGLSVIGLDTDDAKVQCLNAGRSFIKHIGPDRIREAVESGAYRATGNFDELAECDAILICVPTPLGRHREPDNSYIHATGREIATRLKAGQLIVLESTTYPGTTAQELQPILEEGSGLSCGTDFFLAFSPEREDPGRGDYNTRTIPKVVGGVDTISTKLAVAMYSIAITKVVPVSSAAVAESAKLLENIFRSVNIALVNELKTVFDAMDIDVWEVIEAAKTKPFGYMPFYPGPGLGGHCIPLDPFFLSWKAAEHGRWARFIELAGEINTSMPAWVVSKTAAALNDHGKSVKNSKILVLGLAYKPNVDDDRESPSYELISELSSRGALVDYCDPYFPRTAPTRKWNLGLESVALSNETLRSYDAVVVATAHEEFKDQTLYAGVPLVIDTRNIVLSQGSADVDMTLVKA
ncbi:nucleotide sugar dehydrogenase [Nakamurella multipartita]|uniref:Nucleotide sugar dehydrogenase n=1 Tax=Nakamurella multipartita (strain ATCC 700099 / DSM 44233 / CIP 104796 / JCM 9543 / NBRC 105858 / Y-104) TaxID=479431 RepID=C8XCC1_NAKMY|nr:nucleotide sugar dehydrogenase [Nakamurella multipartita]ACV81515.1 nucleotide sugar dehydrogenase [Nakamurella multipartita DSM 44233]